MNELRQVTSNFGGKRSHFEVGEDRIENFWGSLQTRQEIEELEIYRVILEKEDVQEIKKKEEINPRRAQTVGKVTNPPSSQLNRHDIDSMKM